ncbi:hypothetical protein [Propionicicella superfundia]|uniref:hypothetical protein n=1 Tax=Propionicicella superfundia TaxID=348582 RepID=UPI000413D175|nr:hypothetical protein [Propionicicella superfundia]
MTGELTDRARRLLRAGIAGAHIVALVCVVGFALGGGMGPAVTAAVSAVLVIAFFTIGQAVQIRVAERPPKVVLVAALASYTARVTLLGAVLWLVLAQRDRFGWIDPPAAIVTTVLVVHGWLLAEFRAYRRLRIPAFDTPRPPGE